MDSPKALAVSPATPPGLPGSSTDLSSRAVHKHPGEPDDCFYPCFIAGFRLHPQGRTGHSQFYPFTRPNRFAFATAHEFASPGFATRDCSLSTLGRLHVRWAIYMVSTSQLTRSARLAWRTLEQGTLAPSVREAVTSSPSFRPSAARAGIQYGLAGKPQPLHQSARLLLRNFRFGRSHWQREGSQRSQVLASRN